MPGSGIDRRVVALAVALPAVALVVIVATAVLGDGGGAGDGAVDVVPSSTTGEGSDGPATTAGALHVDEEWNAALGRALEPLSEAIPALSEGVTSWASGALDDDGLTDVLDRVAPLVTDAAVAVDELGPHPDDPLAGPLVQDATRLYEWSVDVHRLAVRTEDAELATQYDRLGRRLRVLGDRTFDRARERTAAPFDPGEEIDLRLPAEVPNWPTLGLAAGPPLEPDDGNVDELPLEREDQRASQPERDWADAVTALEVPSSAEVDDALVSGDEAALGALARRLVEAAEELRSVPVPDGDRARADRVALGWLLRADAARAGQLATLDPSSAGPAAEGAATSLAEALSEMSAGAPYEVD